MSESRSRSLAVQRSALLQAQTGLKIEAPSPRFFTPARKTPLASPATIERWKLFQRLREVDSAAEVNWIRLVALIAFYGIHWVTYWQTERLTDAQVAYHRSVNLLGSAWLIMVLAIFLAYHAQRIPRHAKYLSTFTDISLLTAVAAVGDKVNAPIVVVYFVIISLSLLRFDVKLIAATTAGCLFAYQLLLGATDATAWFDESHSVPLSEALLTMVALTLNGCICWRVSAAAKRWIQFADSAEPTTVER